MQLAPRLVIPGGGGSPPKWHWPWDRSGMLRCPSTANVCERGSWHGSEKVETLVRELLQEIGEDPERTGLLETPRRVAAALALLTSGYSADLSQIINHAKFEQQDNNMIIVRDIEIYSLCEHHLLPFFGRCHIGYIPKGMALV